MQWVRYWIPTRVSYNYHYWHLTTLFNLLKSLFIKIVTSQSWRLEHMRGGAVREKQPFKWWHVLSSGAHGSSMHCKYHHPAPTTHWSVQPPHRQHHHLVHLLTSLKPQSCCQINTSLPSWTGWQCEYNTSHSSFTLTTTKWPFCSLNRCHITFWNPTASCQSFTFILMATATKLPFTQPPSYTSATPIVTWGPTITHSHPSGIGLRSLLSPTNSAWNPTWVLEFCRSVHGI